MDSLYTIGHPGTGTFSCFHDGEEKRLPLTDGNKIVRGIEQYYEEAARRLPLNQMPELCGCIHAGGHCFGLGGPVTNIILNAIALLRREDLPPPPPQIPTGRWFQIASRSHTGLRTFMTAYFRYLSITQAQRYLCLASHDLAFAIKLVHHDRVCGSGPELLPDGGKIKAALRIAALEAHHPAPDVLAGLMTARYPSDLLYPIMGIIQRQEPLSTNQVRDIKELLDSQWPPTPSLANIELCFHPDSSSSAPRRRDYGKGTLLEFITPIGGDEDLMARISIERTTDHFNSYGRHDYISNLLYNEHNMIKLSKLRTKHVPLSSNCDASPCEHMRYLKMHLLETIHASYIKALAKIPSSACSARLLHALLVAGHCYGFLDCVSNIILNSIWYNITFPLSQDADVQLPQGILCTRTLSHLESCSLVGMVTILRGTCDLYNQTICKSDHEAFGLLDLCNCNLMMTPSDMSLSAAAKAAKHPKHDYFATFLTALQPDMRHHLSCLLGQPGRISDTNWDTINKIIREQTGHALALKMETEAPSGLSPFVSQGRSPITFPRWFYQRTSTFAKEIVFTLPSSPEMSTFATPEKSSFTSPLAPELSLFPSPVSTLCSPRMSIEASNFKDKLTFVCSELNKVLRDYCYKNPWESSYKLDIVCGVMESSRSFCHPNLYHVNFLVSRDEGAANDSRERKLFFAEFWGPNLSPVQLKLPSCSPVPYYFADSGRCTICETEGSMIVHPPSGGHSGDIKGLVDLCSDAVHDTYKVGSSEADTDNFLQLDELLRAPVVWTNGHRFPGLPLTQA